MHTYLNCTPIMDRTIDLRASKYSSLHLPSSPRVIWSYSMTSQCDVSINVYVMVILRLYDISVDGIKVCNMPTHELHDTAEYIVEVCVMSTNICHSSYMHCRLEDNFSQICNGACPMSRCIPNCTLTGLSGQEGGQTCPDPRWPNEDLQGLQWQSWLATSPRAELDSPDLARKVCESKVAEKEP